MSDAQWSPADGGKLIEKKQPTPKPKPAPGDTKKAGKAKETK